MTRLIPALMTRKQFPVARAATLLAAMTVGATATNALAQASGGSGFEATSAVAVVVKVPKPWYAPKALVVSKMRDTIPQYEATPGLSFKAFSLARADGRFGGVYLWKSLDAARAWFNPAWFERVEKERGAQAQVQFYEVPVAIDNTPGGTPQDSDSSAVATVVTVAIPAGVARTRVVEEFQAAIPVYRKVPGLLRKYFILTDDNRFGGIYLWKDQASAQLWFSDAWQDGVRKRYGSDASLEWFDTPILLPSRLAENRPAIPAL
jgi:heme-degrading monooxygenase HmoA